MSFLKIFSHDVWCIISFSISWLLIRLQGLTHCDEQCVAEMGHFWKKDAFLTLAEYSLMGIRTGLLTVWNRLAVGEEEFRTLSFSLCLPVSS